MLEVMLGAFFDLHSAHRVGELAVGVRALHVVLMRMFRFVLRHGDKILPEGECESGPFTAAIVNAQRKLGAEFIMPHTQLFLVVNRYRRELHFCHVDYAVQPILGGLLEFSGYRPLAI